MREFAPGDRVMLLSSNHRMASVVAGPPAPLTTTPPQALDTILVLLDGDDASTEVWRRSVLLMARVPNSNRVCEFCKNQPVGNAARWVSKDAPATAPCPRCGIAR